MALAQEASKRHPKLKILFTSGYQGQARGDRGERRQTLPLFQKPYRLYQLAEKLRDVLRTTDNVAILRPGGLPDQAPEEWACQKYGS